MDPELKKLLEQFNTAQADIRAAMQTQKEEIKAHGQSSEATGKRIDEVGKTLESIVGDLKAVQARVKTAEDEIARKGVLGPRADLEPSPGQAFVESEQYKDVVKNRREKSDIVTVGSFHRPRATLITSDEASGGGLVEPTRYPQIIAPPDRGLRLRNLLDVQRTDSNAIEYVEETGFTNAAAMRAEGVAKPESALAFEVKNAPAQVIAHWVPATRQIIDDAKQLRSYIDGRLTYGLKLVEETQILYGNGTSPNLQGIATHPDVQTYSESTDGQPGDTKIDSVRRAMVLARVAEYPVTGIALNPLDWADIELMKGSDEHYIWVDVADGGVMRLWRVPVVESNAVTAETAVLGAWSLAATLWDRWLATVRISDSHASYFIENKVAVLAEERVALTIFRPEGFVVLDFDGAPAS